MEELETKAFKVLFQNLLNAGIIRENFKGSITVHINNKDILDYELHVKKSLRKNKRV